MKFIYLILPLFFLLSCNTESTRMTRNDYADVAVGMSVKELESQYGKPYSVYSKGDQTETYEYIERITNGQDVIEQRRYYIIIEGGKVIAKYMKLGNPPPFEQIYSQDPYPNY